MILDTLGGEQNTHIKHFVTTDMEKQVAIIVCLYRFPHQSIICFLLLLYSCINIFVFMYIVMNGCSYTT